MNKIFNWTFGSIFRTLGRILCYLLVGTLFALILSKNNIKITDLLGIDIISAKTFDTTEQYRVYKCDSHNDYENCSFTSWTNNGTSTSNNTNNNVIRGFSMNFGQNETLNGGGHYRVYIAFDTSPQYPALVQVLQNYNCFGVNSNSTSGGEDTNIQSCELLSTIPTSSGVTYIFDVVPAINIKSIKINIYLNTGAPFTSVKGLAKSNLTNDTSSADAINNQTDDLINNQNQNTQQIIDSTMVCKQWAIEDAKNDGYIDSYGNFIEQIGYNKTTQFIKISESTKIYLLNKSVSNKRLCFYDEGKVNISCFYSNSQSNKTQVTIPNNTYYIRMTFDVEESLPIYSICNNGNQTINDSLDNINDSINDDDTTGAKDKASEFFSNFTTNTHGLTGIITAPLNAIQSLASSSCSPLVLPLPFVNQNLTLPCMRQIYVDNFGSFINLYDIITLGIVSYWILVRIFALVKDFKNPDHDEIEVLDL